jgi:hypothetical protein
MRLSLLHQKKLTDDELPRYFPVVLLVTKKPEQFTCPGLIVNEGAGYEPCFFTPFSSK